MVKDAGKSTLVIFNSRGRECLKMSRNGPCLLLSARGFVFVLFLKDPHGT